MWEAWRGAATRARATLRRRLASSMASAAHDELAAEQRHLDLTWSAFERLLRALVRRRKDRRRRVRRRGAGAHARRARPRLHERRAARCTSGASTAPTATRSTSAATRSPTSTTSCWRSTGARRRPSRSTPPRARDPRGVTRRRRLDIEDRRVLGFVDETLAHADGESPHRRDRRGHHAPARRRDAPDHLDDHARAVRADRARRRGRAGHPGRPRDRQDGGRPAPRRLAALRRPGSSRAQGVLVVGPNDVFIAYIAQVLPALGEPSVEQRPIDALVAARAGSAARARGAGDAEGQRRASAALLARLLWAASGRPRRRRDPGRPRARSSVAPADVPRAHRRRRASASRSYQARPRALPRAARRPGRRAPTRAGARHAGRAPQERARGRARQAKEFQRLATKVWPRVTAGGARRLAVQEPPRG